MSNRSILFFIRQIERPVFTTRELAMMSGKSLSAATQALTYLQKEGQVLKVYRGVWAETGRGNLSAYTIIPFLFPRQRAYVSFTSALHLYGIIEQIPQVIMLASQGHTRIIRTKLGTFYVHKIAVSFFKGYDWYKGTGTFLIAEPEKALMDSLYLSSCKKRQFSYFPELNFPRTFSFKKAASWAEEIGNPKIKDSVKKKLQGLEKNVRDMRKD
jgi:predicted transcriptional regulator of viral defense system